MFIFLGLNIEKNIKIIINKFNDLNYIETLKVLNINEIKSLEDKFGDNWYNYFF